MKRRSRLAIGLALLAMAMVQATLVSAAAPDARLLKGMEDYAPPRESTVNGVPESEMVQPLVDVTRTNYRYDPSASSYVTFWQYIGGTSAYNGGPNVGRLEFEVKQSARTGSEWNVSGTISAELKLSVILKLGATVGGGYKEYREEDEAYGASWGIDVSPGKTGWIKAYWGGMNTSGLVYYDVYYDGDFQYTLNQAVNDTKVHMTSFEVNFDSGER